MTNERKEEEGTKGWVRRRRSKRRSWLAKIARYTLGSADARHECKRGHYVRVREVKRFTTPVACGLGQAHKRDGEEAEEEAGEKAGRERRQMRAVGRVGNEER